MGTEQPPKFNRTRHAVIVITRGLGDREQEVHVHGDMQPHEIDMALDQARRQIGTYQETPLDRFLEEEQDLKLEILLNRDGTCRAFVEADLREPGTAWGLLGCCANGEAPAQARRNLARKMSGGTLVLGAMFPSPRYIQVPDLLEETP